MTQRRDHKMAVVGDIVYIMGGCLSGCGNPLDTMFQVQTCSSEEATSTAVATTTPPPAACDGALLNG
eukprot:3902208-Rhodomonas_salina.1